MNDAMPSSSPGTRLVSNTAVAIATNGWSIVVSLLMIPLLVRGLGPAGFGAWALVQGFSAISGWASILDLGLSVGSTRAISSRSGSGRPEEVGRSAVATLVVFGALGAVVLAITATAAMIIRSAGGSEWTAAGTTFASIIMLTGAQASVDLASRGPISVLDGVQRTDHSRIADAVRRTLFLGASGVAAISSRDLVVTLVAGLAASLAATAVPLKLSLRCLRGSLRRPQLSDVTALLREARSVGLLRPLGVVNRTMDRFILGGSIGLSAVGSLEVASSLQAGANALVSASTDPITPAASYISGAGRSADIPELALRTTRISIAISTPLITVLLTAPDILLGMWLGDRVPAMAASFTALSCVALFISLLTTPISNCLVGFGKARVVVTTAALATVLNLLLSIVFAALVGALGVLVGTIASSVVTMPALIAAGRNALNIRIGALARRAWLPGLAPSALLAAGLVIARRTQLDSNSGWITVIGLSMILTVAVTYVVSLTKAERASVRGFLVRLSPKSR